jgi:hypothetical protein
MIFSLKEEAYNVWGSLDDNIFQSFPFFIPNSFNLPTRYQSLDGKFTSPMDVVDFFYK